MDPGFPPGKRQVRGPASGFFTNSEEPQQASSPTLTYLGQR
jgi:hypothetical protein